MTKTDVFVQALFAWVFGSVVQSLGVSGIDTQEVQSDFNRELLPKIFFGGTMNLLPG